MSNIRLNCHPDVSGLTSGFEYYNTKTKKKYRFTGDVTIPWQEIKDLTSEEYDELVNGGGSGGEVNVDNTTIVLNDNKELSLKSKIEVDFQSIDSKRLLPGELNVSGLLVQHNAVVLQSKIEPLESGEEKNGSIAVVNEGIYIKSSAGEDTSELSISPYGISTSLNVDGNNYSGKVATIPFVEDYVKNNSGQASIKVDNKTISLNANGEIQLFDENNIIKKNVVSDLSNMDYTLSVKDSSINNKTMIIAFGGTETTQIETEYGIGNLSNIYRYNNDSLNFEKIESYGMGYSSVISYNDLKDTYATYDTSFSHTNYNKHVNLQGKDVSSSHSCNIDTESVVNRVNIANQTNSYDLIRTTKANAIEEKTTIKEEITNREINKSVKLGLNIVEEEINYKAGTGTVVLTNLIDNTTLSNVNKQRFVDVNESATIDDLSNRLMRRVDATYTNKQNSSKHSDFCTATAKTQNNEFQTEFGSAKNEYNITTSTNGVNIYEYKAVSDNTVATGNRSVLIQDLNQHGFKNTVSLTDKNGVNTLGLDIQVNYAKNTTDIKRTHFKFMNKDVVRSIDGAIANSDGDVILGYEDRIKQLEDTVKLLSNKVSPDGTKWSIDVDNNGNLITSKIV